MIAKVVFHVPTATTNAIRPFRLIKANCLYTNDTVDERIEIVGNLSKFALDNFQID